MATSATYKGKTYANGQIPKAFLKPLDGENYDSPGDPAVLREDAATSWNAARAEVLRQTGIVLAVRGWYRPVPQQELFFFQRYRKQASGGIDARWYKGERYVRFTGAPAAIPGTSNHGLATTVDVFDFGAYGTTGNARRAKAMPILRKYGWTDGEGQSIGEPWHLEYVDAKNIRKNTTPQEVPDMDTTQAKQLSETRAIAGELKALIAELHNGIAPQIPTSATKDPEKITLRAAVRDIRIAVTRQMDDAVAQGVAVALKDVSGVDKAALTAGIVAEVSKAVHAVTESVAGTEYVMTPKEN
jgi:hypothetical protein